MTVTEPLYLTDAYATEAPGRVVAHTPEGGIVLDGCLFYPTGGGQPGDSGRLDWAGQSLTIATAIKGAGGAIILIPAAPEALPPVGADVVQVIDWARRYKHMRMHTALHLLSVVIPAPVTGGAVTAAKGRLDFALEAPLAPKETLQARLSALVDRDMPVTSDWISEEELDAQPTLVKTMSVAPPRGAGRVRLVRIGEGETQADLQPCGGTHVARTSEIGQVIIAKIENKGRQNRRVSLVFEG